MGAQTFVSDGGQPEVEFFSFLERFDAITFVTLSHRRPTRAFFVFLEEQKRAKKSNIRLPVALSRSRTSVLKLVTTRQLSQNYYIDRSSEAIIIEVKAIGITLLLF